EQAAGRTRPQQRQLVPAQGAELGAGHQSRRGSCPHLRLDPRRARQNWQDPRMTIARLEDRRGVTGETLREHSAVAFPGLVRSSVSMGPSIVSGDLLWIDQARSVAALAVIILHVSAGVIRGVPD